MASSAPPGAENCVGDHARSHEGKVVHSSSSWFDERFFEALQYDVVTGQMIAELTFTGTAEELAGRLASLEASGATEVVLQPGGRDPRA